MEFTIVITEREDADAVGHGCDGCATDSLIETSTTDDELVAALSPLED